MLALKIIRKIGKILRGGAGMREIFLGTLFGVMIGFIPDFNFTLLITFLVTLLLNANFSFVLLGAAIGKVLSLFVSVASFHIGFAIIHNIGLEDLFRSLCNAPVTALLGLETYALIGSLPIALAVGTLLGIFFGSLVLRIRKKMLEADQHEIIGKTFGNKFSRFLLWLAFGKSKLSLDDEVPKAAPILRKSGLVLVGSVIVISLALEFFLLDAVLTSGIKSSVSAVTGAEVNIDKAHLSLAKGKLEVKGLQITDPDKPSHNLLQVDQLVADLSVSDLLRKRYTIDLLSGSTVKRDVPRDAPGEVYEKAEAPEKPKPADAAGKSLDEYLAKAGNWKKYGERTYEYLKERQAGAKAEQQGTTKTPSMEDAQAKAKRMGYLEASADLVLDHPSWLIRQIEILDVHLGDNMPPQAITGSELTSHPELVGKPTILSLFPYREGQIVETDPTAKIVMRFDDPDKRHALSLDLDNIPLGDDIETSADFPIDLRDGTVDVSIPEGYFAADSLEMPFTLLVHNLKANVEPGKRILGMDSATANEVFSSIEQLEIEGALGGSLVSPRVQIDYEKLSANIKDALVAAGKKELANRANAEMDKVKEELKQQAGAEVKKLLGGDDSEDGKEGESVEDKAKDALKKLF